MQNPERCHQDRPPPFCTALAINVVHVSCRRAARFVAKRQSNFIEIETETVQMRSDSVAQTMGSRVIEFETVDEPDHGLGE